MKTSATGEPGLLMRLLRSTPGLLRRCCLLLLSRPRLAQPWTAESSANRRRAGADSAGSRR